MTDYFHEHNLRDVITPKSLIMLEANSQQTYVFEISLKNAASGFYNRVSTCDLRFTVCYMSCTYPALHTAVLWNLLQVVIMEAALQYYIHWWRSWRRNHLLLRNKQYLWPAWAPNSTVLNTVLEAINQNLNIIFFMFLLHSQNHLSKEKNI